MRLVQEESFERIYDHPIRDFFCIRKLPAVLLPHLLQFFAFQDVFQDAFRIGNPLCRAAMSAVAVNALGKQDRIIF